MNNERDEVAQCKSLRMVKWSKRPTTAIARSYFI